MKTKRMLAYLIDIIIIITILSLIKLLFPNNIDFTPINESYLNNEITFDNYLNEFVHLNQLMVKQNFAFNLVSLVIMMIYFIIIPYFHKGKTIGKYIFKLQITKSNNQKLELDDLVRRSIIPTGIGYLLFLLILVWILPSYSYFLIENLLGIIQIIVVIISGFMVLYRKDQLSLQDILSKTVVGE